MILPATKKKLKQFSYLTKINLDKKNDDNERVNFKKKINNSFH